MVNYTNSPYLDRKLCRPSFSLFRHKKSVEGALGNQSNQNVLAFVLQMCKNKAVDRAYVMLCCAWVYLMACISVDNRNSMMVLLRLIYHLSIWRIKYVCEHCMLCKFIIIQNGEVMMMRLDLGVVVAVRFTSPNFARCLFVCFVWFPDILITNKTSNFEIDYVKRSQFSRNSR